MLLVRDYKKQQTDYVAYSSTPEANADQNVELTETEKETVNNALAYYQVAMDRKEYRDHSALNQLNANNAKQLIVRYEVTSETVAVDAEELRLYLTSETFYKLLADSVEGYSAEYIIEVFSVGVGGNYVTITLWLPEASEETKVAGVIDEAVQKFAASYETEDESYSVSLETSECKHAVNVNATNNIQNSTNNYINAQKALDAYIVGMTENAKVAYYGEIGVVYTPVSAGTTAAVAPPAYDVRQFLIGVLGTLAVALLFFACYRILRGTIYSKAFGRSLDLDYVSDLKVTKNEDAVNEQVLDSLNCLGKRNGIVLLQTGIEDHKVQNVTDLLKKELEGNVATQVLEMKGLPLAGVMDVVENKEAEVVLLVDVAKMRYGKAAEIVNGLRSAGMYRISCVCIH